MTAEEADLGWSSATRHKPEFAMIPVILINAFGVAIALTVMVCLFSRISIGN